MHTSLRRGKSFRHLKKNLLQNISLPLKSFGKYFDKDMDKSLTHFCKLVSSSTTIFFRPVPTHVFIAAFSPRIFCNLVHSIIPLCHFCMEPLGKKKTEPNEKQTNLKKLSESECVRNIRYWFINVTFGDVRGRLAANLSTLYLP